jgi:hypothetical protein
MRIVFAKTSSERHRFEVVRDDGTREMRDLDTRSFLVHDLAHFAVEQQGAMSGGFWGSLASGSSLDELHKEGELASGLSIDELQRDRDAGERWRAEALAAPFQTLWNQRANPDFAERRLQYLSLVKMDEIFVDGALERMRRLWGQWSATPFRSVMEVRWEQLRGLPSGIR